MSLGMNLSNLVKYQETTTAKAVYEILQEGERLSTEEYPKVVANVLVDYVNGMFGSEQFIEVIMKAHRALQQRLFDLIIKLIRKWASQTSYDERNQDAIRMSRRIVELIDKK